MIFLIFLSILDFFYRRMKVIGYLKFLKGVKNLGVIKQIESSRGQVDW